MTPSWSARGGLTRWLRPEPRTDGKQRGRAEPPDAPAIEAWLLARLADALGIPQEEIDVRVPLDRYGLDSRTAASLSGDLEDWLGRALPSTLIWDYPTVSEVARHLAELASPKEERPCVAEGERT